MIERGLETSILLVQKPAAEPWRGLLESNTPGLRKYGYDVHHIVEKKAAEKDGFSWWQINSRDNLVRIPSMKHDEITVWFRMPNEDFKIDGVKVSPREFLRGKSWEERRKVGLKALIDFGVLKP